jgi:hypothetical protein
MVWENATHLASENTPSPANFLDWRQQTTVSKAWLHSRSAVSISPAQASRSDSTAAVFRRIFDVLGVRLIIGRTFVPQKISPERKSFCSREPETAFGGDPGVIGRAVTLNNEAYTVIGVLLNSVRLPAFGKWRALWVPIAFPRKPFRAAIISSK